MSQRTQERDAQTPTTSQTTTQTSEPEIREEPPRILRLRGAHAANRRGVQWAEDVVDNEGLGRKSSKGKSLLESFYITGETGGREAN